MNSSDDERLAGIERRLALIESHFEINPVSPPGQAPTGKPLLVAAVVPEDEPPLSPEVAGLEQPAGGRQPQVISSRATSVGPAVEKHRSVANRSSDFGPTNLLAWGAIASLLLAVTYFVGLLANTGWLTPALQLIISTVFGLGLIAVGIGLSRYDRAYASYLPAGGVVVLYLTVYAGQLVHELLPPLVSMVLVCVITAAAIGLGQRFRRTTYSICAVVGVYISPLLLQASGEASMLLVFYGLWGVVFCTLAVQFGRREIYLSALYLALFSFDAASRLQTGESWLSHAGFQCLQFLLFASTATIFSIVRNRPMTRVEAIVHAPPLFYFYLLEFALLKVNAPSVLPSVALGSVAIVVGLYFVGRKFIRNTDENFSAILVSSYACLVTTHIIFFELLPWELLPWGGLAFSALGLLALQRLGTTNIVYWPFWIAAGVVCFCGCSVALFDVFRGTDAVTSPWILPVYALVLYGTAYWLQKFGANESMSGITLYTAHFALMLAFVRILDNQLLISVAWALMAIALLAVAWYLRDRILGQSALFVFAISGIKVVLYDLSGAASLTRVGTLLVLGVSLYLGGWLYQRLAAATVRYHSDNRINEHIRLVLELEQQGASVSETVQRLKSQQVECQAATGWTEAIVKNILNSYSPIGR